MKSAKTILPLFSLFILFCGNTELAVVSFKLGNSLSANGSITDSSLQYIFPVCTHCKTTKDFCNFIYFKGDTLCFSIQCNQDVESATVHAYFKNPVTNAIYKAERIEKYKSTIYGFSLVGSLMEKLYYASIPKSSTFTITLPFVVEVTIELHNKIIHTKESNTMHITIVK